MKCSVLRKGDSAPLSICVCYLWEMALNIHRERSFDIMEGWKGIQENAWKVSSLKGFVRNSETSCSILTGVSLVSCKVKLSPCLTN
jgi:hypothetical protein